MIKEKEFNYKPNEYDAEKASNSYLMSVVALMVGLPLPIINLIATLMFYFANRKGDYFVRWHCTQVLFSQISVLCMNVAGFSWTMSILFGSNEITNVYIGYMLTIILFNLSEFIATIYSAIQTRKGKHVEWWLFAALTNLLCKPDKA